MSRFNNTFQTLPPFLFEHVRPTPLSGAKLIHQSKLLDMLNLNLSESEFLNWLNGEHQLPGEQRIATRYAGHQFGVWAGQLGDGRALSLGEWETAEGKWEIQTKGSGLTPFSRMGDGKAVIRSSVREYLCSEAMHGLGIPTTRVLGLIIGTDPVYREKVERSALVARVFPTNLRFGHFELCFHFKKQEELKALIEYTKRNFFPGLSTEEFLREVVKRTAHLMAHWQDKGFCHGVMNTDNMSIMGLTIDYGPFGFLEDTVLNHICNHTDQQGRYAYHQQPQVAMWNLEKLFICFLDLIPKSTLEEILNSFPSYFEAEYLRLSRNKLGLVQEQSADFQLFVDGLQMLHKLSVDYTFFWRKLSSYRKGDLSSLSAIFDYYGNREELIEWLKKYDARLSLESASDEDRSQRMKQTNPKYILRNYIAQEVIEDVEKGNSDKLNAWLEVLYRPFDEHEAFESYARPTPPEHKDYEVSCSS